MNSKKMKQKQEKTFAKELLIFIATHATHGLEWWLDAGRSTWSAYGELGVAKRIRHREQFESQLRRTLYTLEKRGSIKRKRVGNNICIALTEKGAAQILCSKLTCAPKHPQGRHTLVFFDIPEELRTVRILFRRFLKEGGFYQWQKSVWASDRDTMFLIQTFTRKHHITQWVTVCTTSDICGEPRAKQ